MRRPALPRFPHCASGRTETAVESQPQQPAEPGERTGLDWERFVRSASGSRENRVQAQGGAKAGPLGPPGGLAASGSGPMVVGPASLGGHARGRRLRSHALTFWARCSRRPFSKPFFSKPPATTSRCRRCMWTTSRSHRALRRRFYRPASSSVHAHFPFRSLKQSAATIRIRIETTMPLASTLLQDRATPLAV